MNRPVGVSRIWPGSGYRPRQEDGQYDARDCAPSSIPCSPTWIHNKSANLLERFEDLRVR